MAESSAAGEGGAAGKARGLFSTPSSKLGWWAVRLMAVFVVMFFVNSAIVGLTGDASTGITLPDAFRQTVLPFWGISMLGVGVASGIVAVIALVRKRERSWLVWLPVLPALFVVFFLLGEFLVPH